MVSIGTLYSALTILSTAVFLGGAVLLVVRARSHPNPRARYLLAFNLFMWGAAGLPGCLIVPHIPAFPAMSVLIITSGNLYAIFCMFYPLELTRPGWFGLRNVVRLTAPYAVVTAVYFLGLPLTGQTMLRLDDARQIMEHIGQFNVWYRFVLYATICFYLACLLLLTWFPDPEARPAAPPDATIRTGLRIYGTGAACVMAAYLAVLFYGTPRSLFYHKFVTLAACVWILFITGRKGDSAERKPSPEQ